MKPHSRSRWRGSSEADGSSSSSAAGLRSRPIAMFTRCWLPPDRRADLVAGARRAGRSARASARRPPRRRRPSPGARTGAGSRRPRASRRARAAAGTQPTCSGGGETVPRGRRERAREDLQQRGLARAVGPDDRDELAGRGGEGDVAQGARGRRSACSPRPARRAASAVVVTRPRLLRARRPPRTPPRRRRRAPSRTRGRRRPRARRGAPHSGQRGLRGRRRRLRRLGRFGGERRPRRRDGRQVPRLERQVAAQVDDASRAGSPRSAAR